MPAGRHIGIINATTLLSSIDRLDELNVYFFMTRRSAAYHGQHYLLRDPNVGQQAVPGDVVRASSHRPSCAHRG